MEYSTAMSRVTGCGWPVRAEPGSCRPSPLRYAESAVPLRGKHCNNRVGPEERQRSRLRRTLINGRRAKNRSP